MNPTRHYIVLREPAVQRPTFRGTDQSDAAPLEVDRMELSLRDAAKVAADSRTSAMAPLMPMRLIKPLRQVQPQGAEVAAPPWGLAATQADRSPYTGRGVRVAVLDTGINADHEAFRDLKSAAKLEQKDFTGTGLQDTDGHGTHCAATIFGGRVQGVRIGVAPGVERVFIGKVLGPEGGTSEQIVRGIEWAADMGAHVVCMSLGMDYPGLVKFMTEKEDYPVELATSIALEAYRANVRLFERLVSFIEAKSHAPLFVAAAGNESRMDKDPRFQIQVAPPAVCQGIVSVGAVERVGEHWRLAPFSNVGARLVAPGVDVLSARHDGGLTTMSGTSMAAPHVAGVAALWAERIHRTGAITASGLVTKVVGNASLGGMAEGTDTAWIGSGVVRAPLD